MDMSRSIITLRRTVRKFEHDRKCQPWWSFHQREEGKHLVKVTSLSADTNSRSGKSRLDSSCCGDGALLPSNNNHVTAEHEVTLTWPGPLPPVQPEQMTCPRSGSCLGTKHLGLQRSWMRLTQSCSDVHSWSRLWPSCQQYKHQGQTPVSYLSFLNGTQHWNREICLQW